MKILKSLLAVIMVIGLYLALWPIDLEPVAWQAPQNQGYTGQYAENTRMQSAKLVDLGGRSGPEDVAVGPNGRVWYVTRDGWISHIGPDGDITDWVQVKGGKPLGLEFDATGNLIVADAYKGLVQYAPDGAETILTDKVDGTPILYADDLDFTPDGKIWFSDATMRFGAKSVGSTLGASVLDLVEHGTTGRLLSYNPANGETRVESSGYTFANGVAVAADGSFLLMNETGGYRIWKMWLQGPKAGEKEVLIDNLPGFPDNIQRDADGRFWFGLVSERNDLMDKFSGDPGIRKAMMRLPDFLKPKPTKFGAVFAIDGDGNILANIQDPTGGFFMTTGAVAHEGKLYISSLGAPALGIMDMKDTGL